MPTFCGMSRAACWGADCLIEAACCRAEHAVGADSPRADVGMFYGPHNKLRSVANVPISQLPALGKADRIDTEIAIERGRGSLHTEQFQGELVWFIAFDPRVQFEVGINLKSVFTMLRTPMLD